MPDTLAADGEVGDIPVDVRVEQVRHGRLRHGFGRHVAGLWELLPQLNGELQHPAPHGVQDARDLMLGDLLPRLDESEVVEDLVPHDLDQSARPRGGQTSARGCARNQTLQFCDRLTQENHLRKPL